MLSVTNRNFRMRCLGIVITSVMAVYLATLSGSALAAQDATEGARGPGLKPLDFASLEMPVPRTWELTHVQPEHFAKAMGNDPRRIFEFVRDQIAFESYTGCLRGPRGTLLAMAGNSVDRASLLAEMLKFAGHKVRFASGRLSQSDARELVHSMWAKCPPAQVSKKANETSAELQAVAKTFAAAIQRDYSLVRDHLEKAQGLPSSDPGPSMDALVQEARSHVWVQSLRDGQWVDWDPAFADSSPSATYASPEATFENLPDEWLHRVTIRLKVEEYPLLTRGDGPIESQVREVLRFEAPSADLSGVMVMLAHQPEMWKGPADSMEAALSTAIEETGRVKPVLILNRPEPTWKAGEPFQQRLPTGRGLGGVGTLLGGVGSRKPVPIATAQWIEVDLLAPDGHKEAVAREVFDVVGVARRAAMQPWNQKELRNRTGAETNRNVTGSLFTLFFMTGRIHSAHLRGTGKNDEKNVSNAAHVVNDLMRIHITFAATSDEILGQITAKNGSTVRFYCDTPRLHIVDASRDIETIHVGFDLRQDGVRAVGRDAPVDVVHRAQLLRGIVTGTLERVLMEYFTATSPEKAIDKPVMSTSSLFEVAHREKIATVLLTRASDIPRHVPNNDVQVRLKSELEQGYLAVAPASAVNLHELPRYAWWRIDPRTGESIGVTDEGLHGAPATEKVTIKSVLKIIYYRALNIYIVEFTVGQAGLAGTVFRNTAWIDPEEEFVSLLKTVSDTVIYRTIP